MQNITENMLIGEYEEIKLKDLNTSLYTKHEWISSYYDEHLVRIYTNLLEVSGNLSLDVLDIGYAGIIVQGDLKVNGNIENLNSDLGISLCVTGSTYADNLIAGGASVILNKAYIQYFTVGYYNDGTLKIQELNTKIMLNFDHNTSVENTSNIDISVGEDQMIVNSDKMIYLNDLSEFWANNNILSEYVEFEEADEDEDEDDSYYYLDELEIILCLVNGEEKLILNALAAYVKDGNFRKDDLDLPGFLQESIQVYWKLGLVTSIEISDQKGVEELSRLIVPSHLQSLHSLSFSGFRVSAISKSIQQLNQLNELIFEDTQLEKIPDWIKNMNRLTVLEFTGNMITKFPEWIGQLTQLKILTFNYNEIAEIPKSIGNLTQLTELHLAGNKIVEIPECVRNLTHLTTLDVEDNNVPNIPKWVEELDGLEVVI